MPWLLTAWIACQSLDGGTTAYGFRHGFREGNVVMQRAIVPIKVSVNVGAILWYRHTKRRALPVTYALAGCTGGSWNLYQLRRAQ